VGVAEDIARLCDRSSRLGGCRDARGDSAAGLTSGAEGAGAGSISLDPHLPKLMDGASSVSQLTEELSGWPSAGASSGVSSGWLGDGE
jgi:hypothetical protein